MGDVQGGDAELLLERPEFLPQLGPQLGVEVGQRLVQQPAGPVCAVVSV
jgi:hypothetical protein